MKRDEAVKMLQATRLMLLDGANQPISDLYYALDMAIEALEQTEPSNSEKPNNCTEPQYEMGMGTLKCDNCSEYGSFKCAKCDGEMYFKRLEAEDEPQINADQRTQCVESVETMSCQECKHWIFDDRWGWFCPLKSQDECRYEPKDEPQTERRE